MNTCAYTPLLYGKHYLRWAVAAVAPLVEKHIILYTPKPSYGYHTTLPCPDTEEELRACVEEFDHVEWHTGEWSNESKHRAAVMQYLPQNCEILLPVDADEVWDQFWLYGVLGDIEKSRGRGENVRDWRVTGFMHHWRSFCWKCGDEMAPVRAIDLRCAGGGAGYVYGHVHHFGYAQPVEVQRYKWAIHGHKAELRKDCDWLNDKYINWRPGVNDVHPTCIGIWNPKECKIDDPVHFAVDILRDHPFYGKELIV